MNNKFTSHILSGLRAGSTIFVSLVVFFLHVPAYAADTKEPAEPAPLLDIKSVWVNAGMLSYHFDRDKHFQGNNHGFGIEAGLPDGNAIFAGNFVNSVDHHSNYFGWAWRPWVLGPARVGAIVGAFDGYPRMNDGGWFPGLLPVASFEYRYVGVNLLLVPKISDKVYGAAVVQFKLRLK
jgi:hypothetical protein